MLCNFLYVKKNCDAALKAIAVFCIRLRRAAARTHPGNKPQPFLFYFTSASYTAVTLAVTLMLPERMPVSTDSARVLTAPLSDMLLMP